MGIFNFFKQNKSKFTIVGILDYKDKEIVTKRWCEIEELVKLGRPSNFKQAVIEADKLLDFALERMGFRGSLGEKLKSAKNKFSADVYNDVWGAHKIRNRLVHEMNSEILHFETKEAINKFKRGLKNLGAL